MMLHSELKLKMFFFYLIFMKEMKESSLVCVSRVTSYQILKRNIVK